VRLSIDAAPLEQYPRGADGLNAEFVAGWTTPWMRCWPRAGGQIDLHPEDSYKQQLRTSDDGSGPADHALWRQAGRALCHARPGAGLL
jgi:hypothetical protein